MKRAMASLDELASAGSKRKDVRGLETGAGCIATAGRELYIVPPMKFGHVSLDLTNGFKHECETMSLQFAGINPCNHVLLVHTATRLSIQLLS